MSGNTFHNTGDFRGAAVFQGSTIDNAGQIAGTMIHGDAGARDELQALIKQLGDALKPVPPEKTDDANATASAAEAKLLAVQPTAFRRAPTLRRAATTGSLGEGPVFPAGW
jgi:hypothetical protein